MSDLQMSLLAIGAVVVAGVYLFNWLQERKLKRRLDQAFGDEREDVLLREAGAPADPAVHARPAPEPEPAAERREPVLGARPEPGDAGAALPDVPYFDPEFDFVVAIDAAAPIPEGMLDDLMAQAAACGKPFRGAGWNAEAGSWEEMGRSGGYYARLRVAVQLADRRGPIGAAALGTFCEAARHCAERCGGRADIPDTEPALRMARDLDAFAGDVDVAIGINVVAPEGVPFQGIRIRVAAEAAGFTLDPQGVFRFRDEENRTLFTLDNHEPAPLIPEQIRSITTGGVTLLLDVPRVAGGEPAFDRMCETGKVLARALGGRLVDDNRASLTDSGLEAIKQQLRAIHAVMAGRGIEAGSERALRLFA